MANEISVNLQLKVNNPAGSTAGYANSISKQINLTQNALAVDAAVASVPTTKTTFAFADVTTYGVLYLQNLDATNFIQYGVDVSGTFTPIGKLLAGEIAMLRLQPGITFQMKADAAAVQVNYLMLND